MTSQCLLKAAGAFLILALAGSTADARALKWARSGDALTLDPHAQNEGPTHNVLHLIYEPLILRDRTGKLLPTGAISWKTPEDPTVWEFKLRQGVKFHDGSPFNADDVTFSLERALQPNSDMKGLLTFIEKVSRTDDDTVHIKTKGPNPLVPNYLTNLYVADSKIESLAAEIDVAKRNGAIADIWKALSEETIYLALHHQRLAYAMKSDLDLPVSPENHVHMKFIAAN